MQLAVTFETRNKRLVKETTVTEFPENQSVPSRNT